LVSAVKLFLASLNSLLVCRSKERDQRRATQES
jgi:hypothetical protein